MSAARKKRIPRPAPQKVEAPKRKPGGQPALSEGQLQEAQRLNFLGKSERAIAAGFGVTNGALRNKRITATTQEAKAAAADLARAEQRMAALPFVAQVAARQLAVELQAVSMNMASAAKFGSMTANRLSQAAHGATEQLDPAEHVDSPTNMPALRDVLVYTDGANKAAQIPLSLLNANKGVMESTSNVIELNPKDIPADPVRASQVYQRMLGGG